MLREAQSAFTGYGRFECFGKLGRRVRCRYVLRRVSVACEVDKGDFPAVKGEAEFKEAVRSCEESVSPAM